MSDDKIRCSKSVFAGTTMVRGWHSNKRCSKPAKVERDGKWWCAIHDPVAAEERFKQRNDAQNAKWEEERRRLRLERAAPLLADALEAFVAEAHRYGGCFMDQIDPARAALRAAGRLP